MILSHGNWGEKSVDTLGRAVKILNGNHRMNIESKSMPTLSCIPDKSDKNRPVHSLFNSFNQTSVNEF